MAQVQFRSLLGALGSYAKDPNATEEASEILLKLKEEAKNFLSTRDDQALVASLLFTQQTSQNGIFHFLRTSLKHQGALAAL